MNLQNLPTVFSQSHPAEIPTGAICAILPSENEVWCALLDKLAEDSRLWNVNITTGTVQPCPEPVHGRLIRLQHISHGRLLAASRRCGEGYAELKIFHPKTWEDTVTVPGRLLWLSPDEAVALMVDREGGLTQWDLRNASLLRRWDTNLFASRRWDPFIPAPTPSRDGRLIAMVRDSSNVELLDVNNDTLAHCFQCDDDITRLLLTPSADLAITSSFDDALSIWDLRRGVLVKTLTHRDKKAELMTESLSLSQNGRWLFADYQNASPVVWDLTTMDEALSLDTYQHDNSVNHGVTKMSRFSRDAEVVVASHMNHVLHCWDRREGKLQARFQGEDPFTACTITSQKIWLGDIVGRVVAVTRSDRMQTDVED